MRKDRHYHHRLYCPCADLHHRDITIRRQEADFAVCNPRYSGVHLSARTAKSLEVELRIAAKSFHHSTIRLARDARFTTTARDAAPFGIHGTSVGVEFNVGEAPYGTDRGELFCELGGHVSW